MQIYPKKPIYDIPAYPSILAGDLVDQLMEQAEPFKPGFTLGERAETIVKDDEDQFIVTTNRGTVHRAPIIAIAGGLGCFEPRKPPIANLSDFEDKGVEYIIKDPEFYRGKRVVISGEGQRPRLDHLQGRRRQRSHVGAPPRRIPWPPRQRPQGHGPRRAARSAS